MRFYLSIPILVSIFANPCFAESSFFSKRNDLISTRPVIASKQVRKDTFGYNDGYNQQKGHSQQDYNKTSSSFTSSENDGSYNKKSKSNLLANPLGLKNKTYAKKQITKKNKTSNETNTTGSKSLVSEKLDKLGQLDQAIDVAKSIGQNLSKSFPSTAEIKEIVNKDTKINKVKTEGYKF